MPRHDVEMKIPTTKMVLHADVIFEVRSDDEKLGELHVSQGSIDSINAIPTMKVRMVDAEYMIDGPTIMRTAFRSFVAREMRSTVRYI